MLTPDAITQHLFGKTANGIKFGTDRMAQASAKIGDPHAAYPSFHVAGTNGKGSTCAYIESIIRSHGFTTGLFTSPHIKRFEERFMINGRPVATRAWMEVYGDLAAAIETCNLTFFEAITLMAFELFKREKVDWAVFETGMGGRLDATNIVVPKVSVITTIAMDHRDYLGGDLLSIAGEKLGIVKKHVPLIIVQPPQPDVKELVLRHCAERQAPCTMVSAQDAGACSTNGNSLCFTHIGRRFTTGLRGGFQIVNALAALKAAEAAGFSDEAAMVNGIGRTFVPGRFHLFELHNRTVVFDVGHNPNAAQLFVQALRDHFHGLPVCIVAGIMKDKDCAGILAQYSLAASRLILTQPKTKRAATARQLAGLIPAGYGGASVCIDDVDRAVATALEGSEKVVCVAGSFFTVGEAMTALGIEPYGNL